jgi:Cu-Zn family superoxide dismutase
MRITGWMALGGVLALVGCEPRADTTAHAQRDERAGADEARRAIAVLHPTDGNVVRGVVRFEERGDEVRVRADVRGLPPGSEHGFHVHEHGDCSAPDATSAGAHFDPDDEPHALPPEEPRHAGDLGNLHVDEDGVARLDRPFEGLTVAGERAVLGRAVIVHAQADTGRGESGEAGARLACGVIGIASDEG